MKKLLLVIVLTGSLQATANLFSGTGVVMPAPAFHQAVNAADLYLNYSQATVNFMHASFLFAPHHFLPTETKRYMIPANNTVVLSQKFIYAVRTGEDVSALVEQLKNLDYHTLLMALQTDSEKKAFWLNLYNGFTQHFLQQDPDRYKKRGRFFRARQITVAGKAFSLDDIEHGILRRSKIKWSLGYLNKPFPGKMEKELRVEHLDSRIHFALNCGAKSCPPIAFYTPEKLDQQLEVATRSYLSGEVQMDEERNQVLVPSVMTWFRHDFGGKKGMRELLRKHGFGAVNASTSLRFKNYDWSLSLRNFKNNER